ncbi:MAG TPA: hypothetical protein V6D15_00015 [Oculatellaceae cyanobacterium]|jgi:hypothetical protein
MEPNAVHQLEQLALLTAPHDNYFYPTPQWVAEIIVKHADIQPGMTVLEPSAGIGVLCNLISKFSQNLHCIEQFALNQLILTLKGYLVVWDDFLTYQPQTLVQRIIGNPPFPQQELHITHAYYHCLAPNGKLVFLMSNASFESKLGYYRRFRKWFELVGGVSIPLPEELYMTQTPASNVKCYLAIIDKYNLHHLHETYRLTESRPIRVRGRVS